MPLINNELNKIFLDLIKIPSPSGNEKQIVKYIVEYLSRLGWRVEIDGVGRLNHSDTGNVIAEYPGKGKKIVFVAHMDTVQRASDLIRPVFDGQHFKSDGSTILGADNKASIAVLLSLADYMTKFKNKVHIYLIFTTREESGQMGSKYLNFNKIKPDYIFNVDGSLPIGTIDYQSMGQLVFKLKVIGKPAHASIEPEKGISAIKVISNIINKVKMGKLKNDSTFNIGTINGGQLTNVVMPEVKITGEIRAYSKNLIYKALNDFKTIAKFECQKLGAKYSLQIINYTPAFIGKKNSQIYRLIKKIINGNEYKFKAQKATYTSDSSYLSQTGYPTITICKGGRNPHSFEESISITELVQLSNIIKSIISAVY